MKVREKIEAQMNALGRQGRAFVFVIDFEGENAEIFDPGKTDRILWQANGKSNVVLNGSERKPVQLDIEPISFDQYKKGYDLVQSHIHKGDTYLLNYTQPTPLKTDLSLQDIYHQSSARYKVLLKDKFVCFSPEIFVQINDGKISSFPMKGTMDASIPNAEELIMSD